MNNLTNPIVRPKRPTLAELKAHVALHPVDSPQTVAVPNPRALWHHQPEGEEEMRVVIVELTDTSSLDPEDGGVLVSGHGETLPFEDGEGWAPLAASTAPVEWPVIEGDNPPWGASPEELESHGTMPEIPGITLAALARFAGVDVQPPPAVIPRQPQVAGQPSDRSEWRVVEDQELLTVLEVRARAGVADGAYGVRYPGQETWDEHHAGPEAAIYVMALRLGLTLREIVPPGMKTARERYEAGVLFYGSGHQHLG